MSLAQAANQYLDQTAPWLAIKTDRAAAARSLYVALRIIDSLKILFCPFLPHTSQTLHHYLGYDDYIAGPLEFREVTESNGKTHRVLTCTPGTWGGSWQASQLPPGQPLRKPDPLFKKLEPTIVDEEIARMQAQG
jgi:methionyl-tRNA synthetase